MAFEERDMTGFLFKNDRREKDTQPHMQGYLIVDGRKLWVSAWTKNGTKGRFQSLSCNWADERAREIVKDSRSQPDLNDEMSDEIPF